MTSSYEYKENNRNSPMHDTMISSMPHGGEHEERRALDGSSFDTSTSARAPGQVSKAILRPAQVVGPRSRGQNAPVVRVKRLRAAEYSVELAASSSGKGMAGGPTAAAGGARPPMPSPTRDRPGTATLLDGRWARPPSLPKKEPLSPAVCLGLDGLGLAEPPTPDEVGSYLNFRYLALRYRLLQRLLQPQPACAPCPLPEGRDSFFERPVANCPATHPPSTTLCPASPGTQAPVILPPHSTTVGAGPHSRLLPRPSARPPVFVAIPVRIRNHDAGGIHALAANTLHRCTTTRHVASDRSSLALPLATQSGRLFATWTIAADSCSLAPCSLVPVLRRMAS
ncbi:hypothetical protein Purlil1_775 [Purpureocillium lilacinum]|uniref:Uncharacterized protein n=1 Tax=Purpureocillium lilacinum TaxID=33203 RepID=A0ABR0CFY9_PURLI|nr:hypothetical protein Purlil1_775 [Purpureocillium lilacinum]